MDEVEVTMRMPREMFDGAVHEMREWGYTAEGRRSPTTGTSSCVSRAEALFRAAMLEHTPPWEPTEEQKRQWCVERGWPADLTPSLDSEANDALIAAHAVLCEGHR